jgi:hypothetical protein
MPSKAQRHPHDSAHSQKELLEGANKTARAAGQTLIDKITEDCNAKGIKNCSAILLTRLLTSLGFFCLCISCIQFSRYRLLTHAALRRKMQWFSSPTITNLTRSFVALASLARASRITLARSPFT